MSVILRVLPTALAAILEREQSPADAAVAARGQELDGLRRNQRDLARGREREQFGSLRGVSRLGGDSHDGEAARLLAALTTSRRRDEGRLISVPSTVRSTSSALPRIPRAQAV